MIEIREVEGAGAKSGICEGVLRALPEWFGIEASTARYIADVADMPMAAAFDGAEAVGFVALHVHNAYAAEVHVMGVHPRHHRRGIGRLLIAWAKRYAAALGCRYLTVKTLADTHPDAGYARTRAFYMGMGFVPLEVFPTLWDEDNPCLFLVVPV